MSVDFDVRTALTRVAASGQAIAVLGSMNADYTVQTERLPQPGETVTGGPLQVLPGGKSANQASAAARIGARVSLLGAVGDDANADFLLGELERAGVDVSAVQHVHGPSGTTVITVDAGAENTIVYSAGSNGQVSAGYVASAAQTIQGAKTLGLCLESPLEAVIAAARTAHAAGARVLLNNSPFRADLPAELIELADILLVNEHEMSQLLGVPAPADGDWGALDWTGLADRMRTYGFRESIVTLGPEGSYVLSDGQALRIPSIPITAVDTTGCGDAFMGSVLAGLAADLSLTDSARLAAHVAAYAATGLGAQASYGTAEQILAALG